MANTTRYCLAVPTKAEEFFVEVKISKAQMRELGKMEDKNDFSCSDCQLDNTGVLTDIDNKGTLQFTKSGNLKFTWTFSRVQNEVSVKHCDVEFCSNDELISCAGILETEIHRSKNKSALGSATGKFTCCSIGEYNDSINQYWTEEVDQIRFCFLIEIKEPSKIIPQQN